MRNKCFCFRNKPERCKFGYEMTNGQCLGKFHFNSKILIFGHFTQTTFYADIDECKSGKNKCSHYCVNTLGSYICKCPVNYKLFADGIHCVLQIDDSRPQHDYPEQYQQQKLQVPPRQQNTNSREELQLVKYAAMVCPEGYFVQNEKCQGNGFLKFADISTSKSKLSFSDIDECHSMIDDCGDDQSCLNTKGSYLCVPTPCPDGYERDTLSGQCIQLCHQPKHILCIDHAKIAQTISYTILSLAHIQLEFPILKLVNYDINRMPLVKTEFSFFEQTDTDTFVLESMPNKSGIVYVYAKEIIKREKLYKIKIIGRSYDDNVTELLYVTRFIIYVYVI